MQAPVLHHAGGTGRRRWGWALALKLLGLACCAGPLVLLLLFAFGEGVVDEGWGHLLQAAPLAVLLLVAWWRPLAGGALITIVGTGLAVVYAVTAFEHDFWLTTALIFFGPAVVGGLLLMASAVLAGSDTGT
jgi:hypothetical protein